MEFLVAGVQGGGAHLMLSRRLESGLSTDELRIILCRVTMRNTRFTWGQDKVGAVLGLLCLQCEILAKSQPGPPI